MLMLQLLRWWVETRFINKIMPCVLFAGPQCSAHGINLQNIQNIRKKSVSTSHTKEFTPQSSVHLHFLINSKNSWRKFGYILYEVYYTCISETRPFQTLEYNLSRCCEQEDLLYCILYCIMGPWRLKSRPFIGLSLLDIEIVQLVLPVVWYIYPYSERSLLRWKNIFSKEWNGFIRSRTGLVSSWHCNV